MKILVGSENPVKISAVREAFEKVFPKEDISITGIKVDSRIPNQPIGEETFEGARNRALELKNLQDADYFVGLEGGIIKLHEKWFTFGVTCIIDKNGKEGFGVSSMLNLPDKVIDKVFNGRELGDVMDEITGEKNTKKKGGAVGFFTRGVLTRKDLFVHSTILAFVPLIDEHYKK